MSILSPSKSISPMKSKKNKFKAFTHEKIDSPQSNLDNKEKRARATIKKLLEDEAERNEELGEENEILETQIKSLVGLLVEKDQKLEKIKKSEFEKDDNNTKNKDLEFNNIKQKIWSNIFHCFWEIKNFYLYKISSLNENNLKIVNRNSKILISFGGLNKIIRKKLTLKSQTYFLFWKSLRNSSLKIYHLVEALKKLLSKRFFSSFPKKKSNGLIYILSRIFLDRLERNFNLLCLNSILLKISSKNKNLEELHTETTEIERKRVKLTQKVADIMETIEKIRLKIDLEEKNTINLSNEIEKSKQFLEKLTEQSEIQRLEINKITHKSHLNELKLSQESLNFKEKLKNQQEYQKKASEKLAQLIEKHKLSILENEKITEKINNINNEINNIHENYNFILEEKSIWERSGNDAKNEINILFNTLRSLEEEINLLKNKIKIKHFDLNNLKTKYAQKLNLIEEAKLEIEKFEENEILLSNQILNLENAIEEEYEAKEKNIQNCNSDIEKFKKEYEWTKEEIENLKSQLRDFSKKKPLPKQSEELIVLSKKFEENKKKLSAIKSEIMNYNSNNTTVQKEISDLKTNLKQKKEILKGKKSENADLQQKILILDSSINDSKKISKNKQRSKEDLENYIRTLEQQVSKLQTAISRQKNYDIQITKEEIKSLSIKAEKLEGDLFEVNEEASKRRQEIAQIYPEIEKYAEILAALEEKIAENEKKIMQNELETEKAKSETNVLSSRYLSLISELR